MNEDKNTPALAQEQRTMPRLLRCLSIILALKGRPASDSFLMAELGGGRITLQSCLTACHRAGLEGELVQRQIADIPEPVLPCILFLKECACVLVQKDADMVKVIYPDDPNSIHTLTLAELESVYSGRAVFCCSSSYLI